MILETEDFIYKSKTSKILTNGAFSWQAPSNIALVKYWGKQESQIPQNASISFTLNNCHTRTKVHLDKKEKSETFTFDFTFEGKKNDAFKPKLAQFFNRIIIYVPFLKDYHLQIFSENSFPHSSGIASSASSMAALALCIMSLEKALNPEMSGTYFYKKASFLARLGSGSAARSIEGPLIVWGKHPTVDDSSDLYGVKYTKTIHKVFHNYQDTILLVDQGQKQVSSTIGHNLMHQHPFAAKRFGQANNNLTRLSEVIKTGDLEIFMQLVELEALSLHAMMMTSMPYFILMKPNTLAIINAIWEFRRVTKTPVCFTLDAGANVHVLYPEAEKIKVQSLIDAHLLPFCQKNNYICDSVGNGALEI
ncbi:MAG: diphosphomevalonate decarboxylase [Flavobacteriales bacterium]|nr:MAG: diphosphomevalonate decarboxylase [Flavobacteriales bacterium]